MKPVPTLHRKLFCNVKNVVFRTVPIDVFEIKTLDRAVLCLFSVTFAEHKGIVNFFARLNQSIRERLVQFIYGTQNVGVRKRTLFASVFKTVQFFKLDLQDRL